MNMRPLILLTSLLVLATSAYALDDIISVHAIKKELQKENQYLNPEYLVILPKSDPGQKLLLMIYLHGGGRRGSDLAKVESRPCVFGADLNGCDARFRVEPTQVFPQPKRNHE